MGKFDILSFYGHENEELQKEYKRMFCNMTQEEKQLLLKVLCGGLPYSVICTDLRHGDSKITEIDIESDLVYCFDFDEYVEIENIKPYLRPMSSMTSDEKFEYDELQHFYTHGLDFNVDEVDWLLAHHFDYRGLIEKGLAIEAPDGMYKTE